MNELDHVAKSRLRLWLKGEKAFGMSRVPVRFAEVAQPAVVAPRTPQPVVQEVPAAMARLPKKPVTPEAPPALLPVPVGAPFTAPILDRDERVVRLQQLDANEVKGCTRCRLHETRTNTVFGEGDPAARIFFIGEGPGENEDESGRPFVGRAGQLLDKMIAGMGLRRDQVFIANIVKCLRYSTLVQLENGSWERIGRLVRQKFAGRVMSVDQDGCLVPKRVTGWHASPLGTRRVFKISYAASALRGGNRAVTWMTHDHEVLTRRGWVAAEALVSDDQIAVGQGLSGVARELAIGSILGDGTISGRNAFLAFGHCRDQREYVKWKAKALAELRPVVYDGVSTIRRIGKSYGVTTCRTRAARSLRVLRSRFYDGTQKVVPPELRLTPRILAIWFLDDGYSRVRSTQNVLAEIAAHSFQADAIAVLIERLKLDLGIEAYARASSPGRIHFGSAATRKLLDYVAPFCPPCLRYKLHPSSELAFPFDPLLYQAGHVETLYDDVHVEAVEFKGADRSFFCLDVEETHNFVTSGGVVHNCRPPNNRVPATDEVETCTPYLVRQLEIVRPDAIVTLGRPAAGYMLNSKLAMGKLRGVWQDWRGIKLMPTFHPSYVLRTYTEEVRKAVWSDLKQVLVELGMPLPSRGT